MFKRKEKKTDCETSEYDYKMETVNQAIDEIKLLENITEADKYSSEIYNIFRKEVCVNCTNPNCLRSQVEIYGCDKF